MQLASKLYKYIYIKANIKQEETKNLQQNDDKIMIYEMFHFITKFIL